MKIGLSHTDGGQIMVPLSRALTKLGEFQEYYDRIEPRETRVMILSSCLGIALTVCRELLAERGDCFLSMGPTGETCRIMEPEGVES